MSKVETQYHNLPSLQERIVLCLAKKGPQTRNAIKKFVKSAYKNILYSFKSLEKKGLIEIVGQKPHAGQKFPQYWLTFEGLFLALINGSKPQALKKTHEKLHGTSKDMNLVFELVNILPSEELRRLYHACKFGKEGVEMYLPIPMNPKRAKIWRKALKKSPKYQKIIYGILKQAINEFPKEGVKP